jgi:hypothetical protein
MILSNFGGMGHVVGTQPGGGFCFYFILFPLFVTGRRVSFSLP